MGGVGLVLPGGVVLPQACLPAAAWGLHTHPHGHGHGQAGQGHLADEVGGAVRLWP